MKHPEKMLEMTEPDDIARSVTDYIAGMTDHFALTEYEKHFSVRHL